MNNVKYIHSTPDAEKHIAYCARVSNPKNQNNEKIEGLIKYCIENKHWSILEMSNLCVEITTTRAIAAQILRHKSFSFQEHSQRYAEALDVSVVEARRQDTKNRQNSIDDLPQETKDWFAQAQNEVFTLASEKYQKALELGIAKEQARFLLPLATNTKMYMNGNLRSWVTYIDLREKNGTQLEHQEIALETKAIFKDKFPVVSRAMGWL